MTNTEKMTFTGDVTMWREGDQVCVGLKGGDLPEAVRVSTRADGGAGRKIQHAMGVKLAAAFRDRLHRQGIETDIDADSVRATYRTDSRTMTVQAQNSGAGLFIQTTGDDIGAREAYCLARAVVGLSEFLGWDRSVAASDAKVASVIAHLALSSDDFTIHRDRNEVAWKLGAAIDVRTDSKGRVGFSMGSGQIEAVKALSAEINRMHESVVESATVVVKDYGHDNVDELLQIDGVFVIDSVGVRTHNLHVGVVDGQVTSSGTGQLRMADEKEMQVLANARIVAGHALPAELIKAMNQAERKSAVVSQEVKAWAALTEAGYDNPEAILAALAGAGINVN